MLHLSSLGGGGVFSADPSRLRREPGARSSTSSWPRPPGHPISCLSSSKRRCGNRCRSCRMCSVVAVLWQVYDFLMRAEPLLEGRLPLDLLRCGRAHDILRIAKLAATPARCPLTTGGLAQRGCDLNTSPTHVTRPWPVARGRRSGLQGDVMSTKASLKVRG